MAEGPRALLTDRERDAIRGDEDVSDSVRRTLISRVRQKLKNLPSDIQFIREHNSEFAALIDDAMATPPDDAAEYGTEGGEDERLERLEREVERLNERVDENTEYIDSVVGAIPEDMDAEEDRLRDDENADSEDGDDA